MPSGTRNRVGMPAVRRLARFALVLALVASTAFVVGAPGARAAPATPRTDTLLLSGTIHFLVVDNARDRVYVSNANGSVGVINAATDAVLAWVPVGSDPTSMDLAFNGSELFVSVTGSDALAVINLTTDRVARNLTLPFSPGDVAAGRPGRAYVGSWSSWSYPEIVDTDTGQVVGPITAAGEYYQDPVVRISRDRSTLYTTERWSAPTSLSKISVTSDLPVLLGQTPWGIDSAYDAAVSPDGTWFYYANPAAYEVEVFATANWTGRASFYLNTGPYPRSVCLSDYGQLAFAVAQSQTTLFAFNGTNGSLVQAYLLSGDPTVVRALEDGTKAYVITSSGLEVVATGFHAAGYPTPEPVALANATGGYAPFSVTFYSSVMGGQPPYNETWDLGDGATGYGATPAHVYTAPGAFSVRLVVRDAGGATGSAGILLTVGLPPGANPLQLVNALDGLAYNPTSNNWVPPDPQVAVGFGDIVELVNTEYAIWSRTEVPLAVGNLAAVFNKPTSDFLTDPRIVYDPSTLRFFASVADITRDSVLLAVSSLDPTLPWTVTAFRSATGCPDQPYLGVGASAVVVSDNGFSDCTSATPAYLGAEYWLINKTDLVEGAAVRDVHVGPDPALQTMFPASVETAEPDVYLVSVGWAWNVTTRLDLVHISGSPPGPLAFANTTLAVRPTVQPPNGVQRGTTLLVNTGDARVQEAFLHGGDLWVSLGDSCLPVGAAANRSCARVLEIDAAKGTVLQDFDLGAAGGDAYYPSIAVDGSGDLVAAYGFSSATDYPGVRVSAQLPGDAPNTTRAPLVIRPGTAAATQACLDLVSCRYGDYFGASPDPLDPEAVWIVGQYAVPTGWATVVAEVGVFHTVRLTLSYTLTGGGTPALPPVVQLWTNGVERGFVLGTAPQTYTADLGSPWLVTPLLLASSRERWIAESPFFGIAANGTSEVLAFQHQYAVLLAASPPEGGSLSAVSDWFNASATLSVTATANPGWKLARWQGNGTGSYSGPADTADLVVSSAINETAVFDPGLTIEAGAGGSVSYAYGNASGLVAAGTTAVVYLPNGTRVTLTAAGDLLDSFTGWQGNATGNGPSVMLLLDGPESVRASFALSTTGVLAVGSIPAILVVAAVLAVLFLRRRKRAGPPPPPAAPPGQPRDLPPPSGAQGPTDEAGPPSPPRT